MKKIIVYITLAILVAACAPSSRHSGEVTGVGGTAWNEPTPYGMVLISRGSYKMGPAEKDSIWGTQQEPRAVSIDAFWMDETEITNSKYKQFVFWVRDSIIRERLADPAYGGNEVFKIEEDREGNPIKPRLNWDKAIPWRNPNEDEARAIESVYRINPITGERQLDAAQMNYRYEIFDHTEASKRKNRLDPARRDLNTDHTPDYDEIVMISKDTAYIDEDGRIIRETITRPLGSEFDFLNTYIVNIYPDTTVWVNDFENAYNEPYVRLYFSHAGYNDYPVVGVSWEQANAFCAWRTALLKGSVGRNAVVIEPYRLPTEAEWEYAARAGKNENKFPWTGNLPMAEKGCFYANFKPDDGNYVWVIIVTFAIAGLLAEVMRKVLGYKSFRGIALAGGFCAIGFIGSPLPMWLFQESYMKSIEEMGMGAEYVEGLQSMISAGSFIGMLAVAFIGGLLGTLIGHKMLKKHFEKAGIV